MKNNMTLNHQSYQFKSFLLLGFVMLAMIPLLPLLPNALPASLDYLNHMVGIVQADMAFGTGQFPIRVVPTAKGTWEYPLFQFYGSTSYFVAGMVYRWLTPSNPFVAFKITLWSALLVGGVYMYKLAYWLIESGRTAMLTSVTYIMSPLIIFFISLRR